MKQQEGRNVITTDVPNSNTGNANLEEEETPNSYGKKVKQYMEIIIETKRNEKRENQKKEVNKQP